MRTRKLLVLSAVAALGLAAPALAVDAPHDGSFTSGSCDSCHKLHGALGGTLLRNYTENNLACLGCHQDSEAGVPGNRFAMPWAAADQATPSVSGAHHKWGSAAVNGTYGTTAPAAPMGSFLEAGALQCSTCHDPHPASKANTGVRQVSLDTGTALPPTAGTGGTIPRMTLTVAAGTAATARGYRVVVTSVAGAQFRIVLSNDSGKTTPTWLKWDGASWVAAASGSTDVTGTQMSTGTTYSLNDGANVQVNFTGTLAAALEWKFYVSYPFLRVSNTADANGMCIQCHGNRNIRHGCVDGSTCTAGAGQVFSHPVGDALQTNSDIGDATPATMLDADGSEQNGATPDGNKTNDMVLGTGGVVGCLTCHAPHNADSNSLSVDAR